ncbi:MAG: 50S ribosomal protein L9 [Bauldia sp.]
MEVILLERIAKLGQMGEVVRVRDGYARNYLLPQKKALRATDANRQRFEADRGQLEARNLERKREADAIAAKLGGQTFVVVRSAGETGHLYGSVSTRDLADAMTEGGFTVSRTQVALSQPIKTIGLHQVTVALHPEVEVTITANVARSPDEAERQARGEDLTVREGPQALAEEAEETGAEGEATTERFFEEGARKGGKAPESSESGTEPA